MSEESKVTISFRTPISIRGKLVELSKKRDESLSDTVNRVINAYFELLSDFNKFKIKENPEKNPEISDPDWDIIEEAYHG